MRLLEAYGMREPQGSTDKGSFDYLCGAGIEIEIENCQSYPDLRYWRVVSDDSLRNNGAEFVLRHPYRGTDLEAAITEVSSHLAGTAAEFNWRCSVHVHMDVRDLRVEELRKFLILYLIAEPALFQMSGDSRYYNNFCLPLGFAKEQLFQVSKVFALEYPQIRQGIRWNKYSALNLLPMFEWGSVEFRGAEPKFEEHKLFRLTNAMFNLKKRAVEFEGSPFELLEAIRDISPQELLGCEFPFIPGTLDKGFHAASSIQILVKQEEQRAIRQAVHDREAEHYRTLCRQLTSCAHVEVVTRDTADLEHDLADSEMIMMVNHLLRMEGKTALWSTYVAEEYHELYREYLQKQEELDNFQFTYPEFN